MRFFRGRRQGEFEKREQAAPESSLSEAGRKLAEARLSHIATQELYVTAYDTNFRPTLSLEERHTLARRLANHAIDPNIDSPE